MRLADHHGLLHADVVLNLLTHNQLLDCIEYASLTGQFGQDRNDIFFATQICQVANIHRGKGDPAHKVTDFLVYRQPEEQSQAEIIQSLNNYFGR